MSRQQRLHLIRYPRAVPLPGKKDLYWPTLYYKNLEEAAEFDHHPGFSQRVGSAFLEAVEGDAETINKPICRLLGMNDGTYIRDFPESDLLSFVPNLGKKVVTQRNKDQYFDFEQQVEQRFYILYQNALKEAKSIMDEGLGDLGQGHGGLILQQPKKKQKTEQDDENNGSGGGDGGGDDKPDDNDAYQKKQSFAVRLESAVAAAAEAPPVAAAVTAEPVPNIQKKQPPGTPPFNDGSFNVDATEPWANVWKRLRRRGWNRRESDEAEGRFIFTKPDKNTHDGVRGVDYFTSERDMHQYIKRKFPHWQPPVPIGEAAERPALHDDEDEDRPRVSSAATVVTAGSVSPQQMTKKAPARARRMTVANAVPAALGPDRLWWQNKSGRKTGTEMPTLSDVRPILHKLGVRQDEEGCFHVPETTQEDVETPVIEDLDDLRKYLCTKGVPNVLGRELLDKNESEQLHRWVSFAYVPPTNTKKLQKTVLPSGEKITALLLNAKFEKCDDTYFPPKVDHCGVKRDIRIPGLHFYRGLAEARDYIRRTKSFAWTADELEATDEDVEIDPEKEFLIRLWAASSPSPLPTYNTSEWELRHMEETYPESEYGIESETEEEEENIASEEESEGGSYANPGAASGSSNEEVSASEESAPESESSGEDSPAPVRRVSKATGKRTRDADKRNQKPKISQKKAKKLPWWQVEPVPSFEQMKPILKKLRIVQDKDGIFLLPGKDKIMSLKDPESLRKNLISEGIPKFNDHRKPCLNDKQKELLRRWVSFAHVPVTRENSVQKLQEMSDILEKHLSKELRIVPFLGRFGFQRYIEGSGFYPPGIDRLGRDKNKRAEHVKKNLTEVREYIRCSERLDLVPPPKQGFIENSDYSSDEDENDEDKANLLALRLWGALGETPLPSYFVEGSSGAVDDDRNQTAATPVSKKSSSKKKAQMAIVDYPDWWDPEDQVRLTDRIEELKEQDEKLQETKRGRCRCPEAHMKLKQLELACEARSRLETIVYTSPRKGGEDSFTLQDQVDDLAEEWEFSAAQLQAFLTGDPLKLVRKAVHEHIEKQFRKWLHGKESHSDEKPVVGSEASSGTKDAISEDCCKPAAAKPEGGIDLSEQKESSTNSNDVPSEGLNKPAEDAHAAKNERRDAKDQAAESAGDSAESEKNEESNVGGIAADVKNDYVSESVSTVSKVELVEAATNFLPQVSQPEPTRCADREIIEAVNDQSERPPDTMDVTGALEQRKTGDAEAETSNEKNTPSNDTNTTAEGNLTDREVTIETKPASSRPCVDEASVSETNDSRPVHFTPLVTNSRRTVDESNGESFDGCRTKIIFEDAASVGETNARRVTNYHEEGADSLGSAGVDDLLGVDDASQVGKHPNEFYGDFMALTQDF